MILSAAHCSYQATFLTQLSVDPSGLNDDRNIQMAFRARKAFETWQNDHDKSYKMPEVYRKLQDFCAQYQRTKKAKASSGSVSAAPSPAPAATEPASPAPAPAETVPPAPTGRSKKVPLVPQSLLSQSFLMSVASTQYQGTHLSRDCR